jgi:hypothetical protein
LLLLQQGRGLEEEAHHCIYYYSVELVFVLFVLVGWCVRANLPGAIGSHVNFGFLVFGVPYCIYHFCIARYFAF